MASSQLAAAAAAATSVGGHPPESFALATSLPDALFSNVASYLAKPSRALLAEAMTAPSSSWQYASKTGDGPQPHQVQVGQY